MTRRFTARGRPGGTSRSQEAQFLALFHSGAVRIDTDRYASSGGNVTAFVDYADASHLFAVDAGTLPVPTADAALAGAPSVTFSAHRIKSSRAASAWKYLHDGSPCEVFEVAVPTSIAAGRRTWFATTSNTGGAGDTGAEIFTDGDAAWLVNVTSAGTTPILAIVAGQVAAGTAVTLNYSAGTTQAPDVVFRRNSSTIASGDYLAAVSAADPTSSLCIGADSAGSQLAAMRWAAFYAFPRILTAAERATVCQWIRARYGIAP